LNAFLVDLRHYYQYI